MLQQDYEMSILIIEDETEIADIITSFLKELNFRVNWTDNVPDAVTKLRNQKYSLVILDIRIKKGTGEDVLAKMRMDNQMNQFTPVLVTSGHLDKDMISRQGRKVQGALVKPYDVEQLKNQIFKILGGQVSAQEVA